MRRVLCNELVKRAGRQDFIFLTGDLGFDALEPLREVLGPRFVNAGVAEQNMVSVAAGMAHEGLRPWVYSIASFMVARPFEQIRNDVAFGNMPVVLVGNGGGYGYGVMGPTHHALEDYGILATLPNMNIFIPAFNEDIGTIVQDLFTNPRPSYLRLGRCEKPASYEPPVFSPWRKITTGDGPVIIVTGPLIGGMIAGALDSPQNRCPNLWLLSALPLLSELPDALLSDVRRTEHVKIYEEHVKHGGVGAMIAYALLSAGVSPRKFEHRFAKGYPSGRYGSQSFHRHESGLALNDFISETKTP